MKKKINKCTNFVFYLTFEIAFIFIYHIYAVPFLATFVRLTSGQVQVAKERPHDDQKLMCIYIIIFT